MATSAVADRLTDAEQWELLIPRMGYMAVLRNLAGFDRAGISEAVATQVCTRIADADNVKNSRQFPFRFLSAYRAAPSLRWGHALEQALTHATANIPELPGRSLVLVDTSSSMQGTVSGKSQIRHVDVGALIGVALAYRMGGQVDLCGFADGVFKHDIPLGGSMLRAIEAFTRRIGEVGHGTQTIGAIEATFKGHDRVIVVTDGQAFAAGGYYGGVSSFWGLRPSGIVTARARSVSDAVPSTTPLFGIDTTGYSKASIDTKQPNRFEIGSFSDACFKMFAWAASGTGDRWPWDRDGHA